MYFFDLRIPTFLSYNITILIMNDNLNIFWTIIIVIKQQNKILSYTNIKTCWIYFIKFLNNFKIFYDILKPYNKYKIMIRHIF